MLKIFKKILIKSRRANRDAWKRKGSLDSISDYLSLQECKVLLNDITERVIKQGYAEDIEFNDSGTTLTYFIEGEKYDYALIPSMS